jgi:hypothetical protein
MVGHFTIGGSMKVGDLVVDHSVPTLGMIVANEFTTEIGTPFDWAVFYFETGDILGADTYHLEVL